MYLSSVAVHAEQDLVDEPLPRNHLGIRFCEERAVRNQFCDMLPVMRLYHLIESHQHPLPQKGLSSAKHIDLLHAKVKGFLHDSIPLLVCQLLARPEPADCAAVAVRAVGALEVAPVRRNENHLVWRSLPAGVPGVDSLKLLHIVPVVPLEEFLWDRKTRILPLVRLQGM